jgi:hypothetical protein
VCYAAERASWDAETIAVARCSHPVIAGPSFEFEIVLVIRDVTFKLYITRARARKSSASPPFGDGAERNEDFGTG